MKLKTIRVRRSHPSALSAALALMLTMLCVYLVSLSCKTENIASPAANTASAQAEVRMDALNVSFECDGRYDSLLDAQVAAAKCAQSGGAGLILPDGEHHAVIRCVSSSAEGENVLRRSANGLTMKISGSSSEISAIADAVDFLRSQAVETGSLPQTLESGDVDAPTVETLLRLYRTRAEKSCTALSAICSKSPIVEQLRIACNAALERLDTNQAAQPARIRLIQAAACADWIDLLQAFSTTSP